MVIVPVVEFSLGGRLSAAPVTHRNKCNNDLTREKGEKAIEEDIQNDTT
jgi:hypothetical protein